MRIFSVSKKIFPVIFIFVLSGILAGSAFYFYTKYQKAQALLLNPAAAAQEETKSITNQLGKLMTLPNNEDPTVATVLDINKLKNQPFFANAKNGDKVIIYVNSKKAILFRPSENKIIDFSNLTINPASSVTSGAPQVGFGSKIAIYNGTNTSGLAQNAQDSLLKTYPDASITLKADAKNKTYGKTLVIDLTGNNHNAAVTLAKELNATVSPLPAGEVAPSGGAELLVILGNDYGK